MYSTIIAPISSAIALAVVGLLAYLILKEENANPKMVEIANAVKEGAMAYLIRQYKTLVVIMLIIAAVLTATVGYSVALAFTFGATLSGITGYIGMKIAVESNSRTAYAASTKGLGKALTIAFRGGAVMGLGVVGVGLAGIVIASYFYGLNPETVTDILGFSFGASTIALFMRVGGGIYTKAADVGADLVGKVEAGIPEDDPRNAAVIADNVGDNVGDCAGVGADLFESYVGSIIATMVLGIVKFGKPGAILPMAVAGVGILASIMGVFMIRSSSKDPGKTMNLATAIVFVVILVAMYPLAVGMLPDGFSIYLALLSGLLTGVVIGVTTSYFTTGSYKPTLAVAEAAKSGAGINIIMGFSMGLLSTVIPVIAIGIAVLVSYFTAGIYGVAISAVGMLSVTGMILAADSYGPISDNAGGIAEMSGAGEEIRKITDTLDALGNTTKAISKGFAIGSAALTALALFATYTEVAKVQMLDLLNPKVIAGVFIGAAIVAFFIAITLRAVGKNAFLIVEEVRRQFREIPGIMEFKAKPDYAKCVDITTTGALRSLILPGVVAIITPPLVGLVMGKEAAGGLLVGAITVGLIFGLLMANAGATWDNAKKLIEQKGLYGGKRSTAHQAAVVGDTTGDPFKDTSGPSLNILIKLMSIVAVVFAPLFI
ncbi:MAG: sodium-translocating pyrophosphatase [Euryarchaeota archaeon]|nr:sodium-translocating pyrophosphatase [Euryarchaeota archaeon]